MFKFEKYFTDEVINEMLQSEVYLCGLTDFGIATGKWLESKGISVCEINRSHLKERKCRNPLFVVADFKKQSAEKWEKCCKEYYPEATVIQLINPVEIRIEISGNCNLRCLSCQTGNHNPEVFQHKGRGFMTPERFIDILNKVEQEYPDLVSVFFFICGEPFLNPQLKELLRITKERGLLTVLSSNLSLRIAWEQELLSLIDVLKISVSGFYQEIYETTHNGGNIELVKENMYKISEIVNGYHMPVKVLVGYHVYTNNRGRDYEDMKALCEQLKFDFCPVDALYFNLFYRSGAEPFPEKAKEFIQSFYQNPEKILNPVPVNGEELKKPCRNRRDKLFIDWDGKVMLCEILHKDAIFCNYTEISREKIEEWRNNHLICQLCRQYGLDYK